MKKNAIPEMMQIVPCIRFGEVLLDENQKFILLCSNCHKDYTSLNAFQKHFNECKGAEQLIAKNCVINFVNNENLYEIKMSPRKQFRIYKISAVNVSQKNEPPDEADIDSRVLDLESELLDPRWYTVSEQTESVKSTSTIVSPNSGAKTKHQPFKENLKANKDVNTQTNPDSSSTIAEVTPRLNRLKRSHDSKGQQEPQQNEAQPSLLISRQMDTTATNTKSTLKRSCSPDAKASPDLQIRRNHPKQIRLVNNKEPKDMTTNNKPKEQNTQQNEPKQSLLTNRQKTVIRSAHIKSILNGSMSCNVKMKPNPPEVVMINNNDPNSIKVNNPKGQNQPNESQQQSLLINQQPKIPITANNNRLSNEPSSNSVSVITSVKKPNLSEPTIHPEVPPIKGITLSKPTIISVTNINPPFDAGNQNVKPTNVAARPQLIGSHETKEMLNIQIPTQTKETEKILNKLQNLGVAIKRTSVISAQSTGISTKDSKALKIIQKLQSNGVKVITMKPSPSSSGGGGGVG